MFYGSSNLVMDKSQNLEHSGKHNFRNLDERRMCYLLLHNPTLKSNPRERKLSPLARKLKVVSN